MLKNKILGLHRTVIGRTICWKWRPVFDQVKDEKFTGYIYEINLKLTPEFFEKYSPSETNKIVRL